MSTRTGKCLCGSITYELKQEPLMAGVCHCKNCQRQAGSAFSTLAGVPKDAIEIKGDTLKTYEDGATESGGTVQRVFCGNCGSPIYSVTPDQPDVYFIKTGTLDDTSGFTPQFHIWCDSKQAWVDVPDGVPAMPKQ